MSNVIVPHSYYLEISSKRRLRWYRKREQFRRTGKTPPLEWADPKPVEVERRMLIDWGRVIHG